MCSGAAAGAAGAAKPKPAATARPPKAGAGGTAEPKGDEKKAGTAQTERDAKRLFPEDRWNKLHLQIIFYGREYSPARSPKRDRDFITRTIGRKSEVAKLK